MSKYRIELLVVIDVDARSQYAADQAADDIGVSVSYGDINAIEVEDVYLHLP